jgi:hypothetical protein
MGGIGAWIFERAFAPPVKAPIVPVDPLPAAPVVAPLRHTRKLAFTFGALATAFALYLVTRFSGWPL